MTKFTIVCETDSDALNYARSLGRLEALSVRCRHIGGKTVEAVVAPEASADVESLLERLDIVSSFQMLDA